LNSKKLLIGTLLGGIAFSSSGFLPSPVDKMFIAIQALTFALSSLVIGKSGALYASLINGVLLSVLRSGFFPFSLIFSLIYGLIIDSSFQIFKVYPKTQQVKGNRLILCLAFATGTTGVISMYLTTLIGLIPIVPIL
jgi:hypothetical protein